MAKMDPHKARIDAARINREIREGAKHAALQPGGARELILQAHADSGVLYVRLGSRPGEWVKVDPGDLIQAHE